MDLQTRKLNAIGYLISLQDERIFNKIEVTINSEKAQTWIKNGAQPTDTVKSILKKAGVIQ